MKRTNRYSPKADTLMSNEHMKTTYRHESLAPQTDTPTQVRVTAAVPRAGEGAGVAEPPWGVSGLHGVEPSVGRQPSDLPPRPSRTREGLCSHKKLYVNVHNNFILKSPKPEVTRMSLKGEWVSWEHACDGGAPGKQLWCVLPRA